MSTPTTVACVRSLTFLDSVAASSVPVHVVSRFLIDGEQPDLTGQYARVFTGVTVTASLEDATTVTFHGVYGPSIAIEKTGDGVDGELIRLTWAGREWLTPRDDAQVAAIRVSHTEQDLDACFVDLRVFVAEVAFCGPS